jgi:hypothetical protein
VIRFDEHGTFEVTNPELLRQVAAAGVSAFTNVICLGGPGENLACPNQLCEWPPTQDVTCYENVVCEGLNNVC